MYIAKNYFETRFSKYFKKGEVVPAEIAEQYLSRVTIEDGELLTETPIEVETEVIEEELEEVIETKKSKKNK